MADIARTTVRLVEAVNARTFPGIAKVALAAGDFVYFNSGKLDLADDTSTTKADCVGMVTQAAAADAPCTVLYDGCVAGFTLSGKTGGEKLWISATAGKLADAATVTSTHVVNSVARVIVDTSPDARPYLLVQVAQKPLVAL